LSIDVLSEQEVERRKEEGGQDRPSPTSGELRLYLPLVLKIGEEAEPGPTPTPTPGVTPGPPAPEVDLDEDPPIGDGPSLPPPEIDQQTEPPLEEGALPEGTRALTALPITFEAWGEVDPADEPGVLRARYVEVDFQALAGLGGPPDSYLGAGHRIRLNLFEEVGLTAVLEPGEAYPPDRFTWAGYLEGVPESRVNLAVDDERLTGEVVLPDVHYRVRYVEDRVHVVDEMAPDGSSR
jgi:hypothetical protein